MAHNLLYGAALPNQVEMRSVTARDFGVAHSRRQHVNAGMHGMRLEQLPFEAKGW